MCGEQVSPTGIALLKAHVVFPTGLFPTKNILRIPAPCPVLSSLSTYAAEQNILFLHKVGKNLGDFLEDLLHYFTWPFFCSDIWLHLTDDRRDNESNARLSALLFLYLLVLGHQQREIQHDFGAVVLLKEPSKLPDTYEEHYSLNNLKIEEIH